MRITPDNAPRGTTHTWLRNNVLGLVAIFIALSGTAVATQTADTSGDNASKAAKKKKAKAKPGPQGPQGPQGLPGPSTGPAGGDLTGTYPNPTIAPNAVNSAKVADDSLAAVDIAPDAITASEAGPDSIGVSELALDSVGSSELKGANAAVSAGTDPGAGYATQTATCDAGEAVIGGGFAWDTDTAATIVSSTPTTLGNPTAWSARGGNTAAGNTLFAWALCLDV